MTRKYLFAIGLIVLLQSAVSAQQVYNVNFTSANSNTNPQNVNVTADGTPWAPEVAPFDYGQVNTFWDDWRAQGAAPARDLTDSTGDANNGQINFSLQPVEDPTIGNFSQLPPEGGLTPVVDNYIFLTDGFSAPPSEAFWQLSNLEPNSSWDLYFISQGDRFGQGGAFRLFSVEDNGTVTIVNGAPVPITAQLESAGETPQAENLILGADFNGTGNVDGADFMIWQRGFGLTGQEDNTTGNANFGEGVGRDDVVNGGDLGTWGESFGQVVEPAQYEEGVNYVVFRDVQVGDAGVIIGGWDDNNDIDSDPTNDTNFAILNGAQFVKTAGAPVLASAITAIPEPTTLVSLLLGSTLLLARRTR